MLGDIFTDYELVEMVTSSAAIATNWDNEVGTLEAGKVADLVVVDNIHANPYRNLINAIDPDVRLTVVGGLAVYGDEDIMRGLKGEDIEPAGKFGKAVDVTYLAAPDGAQSWSSIVENLTMAMRFDVEEMTAAFGDANDFDSVTRGMTNVGLDPWYTYGDERYFNVLNNSGTANFQWDMSLLYDRYYDRAETLDAVTELEIVEEPTPEPCEDGTQPPCESNDDTTGTNDDTTGTNDDTTDTTTEPDTNQNNDGVGTPVERRALSAQGVPCRHWKMAECSESAGSRRLPLFFSSGSTTGPAAIRVSLLARARSFPARIAARVGNRPAQPTIPVTTRSALSQEAATFNPSGPPTNWGVAASSTPAALRRSCSSGSRAVSARATTSGRCSWICSTSKARLRPAVSATTLY